jgi:Pyridoxamine 5'-phosphate oxidase
MTEPIRSRPYWPDALQNSPDTAISLKSWAWAVERLEKSHNYWIATSRPDGHPHLMVIWGVWWRDAFWFSTGRRTRKARNIAARPECVIGTEGADEAVIAEGTAAEISDERIWKELAAVYDIKYGGDLLPLLQTSQGTIFQVQPLTVFGQDEHAENFTEAVTKWSFRAEKPRL